MARFFSLRRAMDRDESFTRFHHPTENCFFCNEKLVDESKGDISGDVVAWNKPLGEIWLHPKCAIEFAVHLIRDGSDKQRYHRHTGSETL